MSIEEAVLHIMLQTAQSILEKTSSVIESIMSDLGYAKIFNCQDSIVQRYCNQVNRSILWINPLSKGYSDSFEGDMEIYLIVNMHNNNL